MVVGRLLACSALVGATVAQTSVPPSDVLSQAAGEDFGLRVAFAAGDLIVGDPSVDGDGPASSGAVHVYQRRATGWTETQTLVGPIPGLLQFGIDLATSGDTLAITPNGSTSSTPVYVYRRVQGAWAPEATLTLGATSLTHLGLDGDRLAVGIYDGNIGYEVVILDRTGVTWSEDDRFPWAVSGFTIPPFLDPAGDVLLGYGPDDLFGASVGIVRVFVRTASGWVLDEELAHPNGGPWSLSVSAALEDTTLIVLDEDAPNAGTLYVYERDPSLGWQLDTTIPSDPAQPFLASNSFHFAGDEVAARTSQGVRVLDRSGGAWEPRLELVPGLPPLVTSELARSRTELAVGNASGTGRVEVFRTEVPESYCTAKTSSAGCVGTLTLAPPTAPASLASSHAVTANDVEGARLGLLLWSHAGATAVPFLGGTLCVQPPLGRGPATLTSGTPGACDGSYALAANDGATTLDPGPGGTAWLQGWYRDPLHPDGTGVALTDALEVYFY